MNTPNKLTILRIVLVPFFLIFLMWDAIPHRFIYALIIFVIAALTDAIDGHLARKHDLVTTFGKFLDPLADKILVTSALICFIELNFANSVVVAIIIAREFLVTSLRLVAADGGVVIAASIWGKLKTITQMGSIITILLFASVSEFIAPFTTQQLIFVGHILLGISALVTVISGLEYLWANRHSINTTK